MKTHDEIKKGLEHCAESEPCVDCVYDKRDFPKCIQRKSADALALIQQLEAQAPNWISVEERLPKKDERVLFFAKDSRATMDTAYGWWVRASERYKVTHWMPLPEPPEED